MTVVLVRWLSRFLLGLCLAFGSIRAATLPIRIFSTAQGLAHDHINRLYRDSRGFLWICTDEGLSRFDGNRFVNYTVGSGLSHIHVNDILETHAGEYWIATDGGLAHFHPDGRPKPFDNYLPGGPNADRVNALAEDLDGSILAGTAAGLYGLRRRGTEHRFDLIPLAFPNDIPEASTITSLHLDRAGVLWVGSVSGLYRRGKDGTWNRLLVGETPDLYINSILEDPDGQLWICTRQHGFGRFAGADGKQVHLDPLLDSKSGLPDTDVRSLWFGSDGRRWAGTPSGLVEWSNPRSLSIMQARDGLSDDSIYALAEDPARNLWIGTRRGGVMRLGRAGWKTFDRSDGLTLGPDETLVETPAGAVCVADISDGRRPLRCQDKDRFVEIVPPLPPSVRTSTNSSEMVIQDREGAWWFSTGQGVFRFAAGRGVLDLARSQFMRVRPDLQTTRLFEDSRGDVWIGTISGKRNGLLRWERAGGQVHDESQALAAALAEGRVSAFAEAPAGQLWIGLAEGGALLRLRNGRFQAIRSRLAGRINDLYAGRDNRLWIASLEGGLGRIDHPEAASPAVQLFTAAQGLASNEIWCLTEDTAGRIYAGNARGVDRINPATGDVLHYSEGDGLVKGDIRSALRDHNGDLWFLSNRGVSRFRPTPDLSLPAAQARITALHVAGNPWPLSDLGETSLGPLELSARQNSLTVEFGAIDYSSPSRLLYQYRLDGASGGWSAPAPDSSVTFANLSPGHYRFLVRTAASTDPSAAAISFTILTPLWMRWWVQLLILLTLGAIGYALHRSRLESKLALERVRSHVAMDLHDDLGASLSRIAVVAEVMKSNVSQNDLDSQLMLSDIADTSRRLVQGMGDIVWSIDPRHDQAADIVDRLRDFASAMLEAKGIHWELDATSQVMSARLSARQRRQLYLVCKEAIHNIARHSKARNASVRFRIEHGVFQAEIEDDGCGIPSENGHGLGLRSMRGRAAELGGSLHIAAGPAQGTRVALRFPLRQRNA